MDLVNFVLESMSMGYADTVAKQNHTMNSLTLLVQRKLSDGKGCIQGS